MTRILSACLLVMLASEAYGQEGEDVMAVPNILGVDPDRLVSLTKAQKDYAKEVGEEVVCLCGTCPRHTITMCDCGWAHKHKRTIELALLDGKTREQIKAAYMQAYGTKAFPRPPGKWGSLTWIIPYAGGIFLLGLFVMMGLRMRRRQAAVAAVDAAAKMEVEIVPDDEDHAILDKELGDLD